MAELSRKLGEMEFDGLITDMTPAVEVRSGTIAAQTEETTFVRGTIVTLEEDGTLAVLGSGTGTPTGILTDDVTVGTEDTNVTIYTAGCFDPNKVTVADGYTLSDDDKDTLRKYGIVFRAALD